MPKKTDCIGMSYVEMEASLVALWRGGILSGRWTEEEIPCPTVGDTIDAGIIKVCSKHKNRYISTIHGKRSRVGSLLSGLNSQALEHRLRGLH